MTLSLRLTRSSGMRETQSHRKSYVLLVSSIFIEIYIERKREKNREGDYNYVPKN